MRLAQAAVSGNPIGCLKVIGLAIRTVRIDHLALSHLFAGLVCSLVAARMVQNLICAGFALWAPWPHMEVFKDAALAPRERWLPEDACANMW